MRHAPEDLPDDREHRELVEEAREFRTAFGFDASDEAIERLIADMRAGRNDRPHEGLWLTVEEQELWDAREELFEKADVIQRYGEEVASDAFAGLWCEHVGSGQICVRFSKDVEKHAGELRRRFAHPETLRVFPAEYSEGELEGLQERLGDDDDELSRLGIDQCWSDIDLERNVVEVGIVTKDADHAKDLLRRRYGDALRVEVLGPNLTEPEPSGWDECELHPDGRTLTIHYMTGPSREFERVHVDEGPDEVVITIVEQVPVGGELLAGILRSIDVELKDRLGARRVVDGATGLERPRKQLPRS
jgi:hypothetical protein